MTNAYIPPDCSCPPAQVKRVDGDGRPLPQQFGAQKVAMYQALSDRIPFAHWQTAREDDIGAMVLDWFALLSDNLSFYSDQWIREQHLATATRETSLRQLSTMTGYQPRPNLAARAQLAVVSNAEAPVVIDAGLGVTSEGNDDHPALPFETVAEKIIDPALNMMTAIMPRQTTFDPDFIAVQGGNRNLRIDEPVMFASPGQWQVRMLTEITTDKFPSGDAYAELQVSENLSSFDGLQNDSIKISSFASQIEAKVTDTSVLTVSGLHPNLTNADYFVALNNATGELVQGLYTNANYANDTLISDPDQPVLSAVTNMQVNKSLTIGDVYTLYYKPIRGARLIGTPMTHASLADFDGRIAAVEKFTGDNDDYAGDFVVQDAEGKSVRIKAALHVHPHNKRLALMLTELSDEALVLKAPLQIYGNFIDVDQGKTVVETLGSAAGQQYQTFKLAQKPLTFIPQTDGDPVPAIEVFVDHAPWRFVPHLYGLKSDDQVFALTLDAEGQAEVILGGVAKPGNKNVVARYRHLTTGDNPKAGTINKPDGRISGVSRLFNPFDALAGLTGDTAADIRAVLPLRISANDRCVSSEDYAVLSRNFGALSAAARLYWNAQRKRAGVAVTVIFEGGLNPALAAELRAYLTGHAPQGSLVDVFEAQASLQTIRLSVVPRSMADVQSIQDQIQAQYFGKYDGLLSPRRIVIGKTYRRTDLLLPLAQISEIKSIRELVFNDDTTAVGLPVAGSEFLSPLLDIEVTA